MPEDSQNDFTAYESHRQELADVALMFFQHARVFPGTHFQFLQANKTSILHDEWSAWIAANRSSDDEDRESWEVYPKDWCIEDDPRKLLNIKQGP
jgi:hypothetical protein